jgi:hypothetical protein
MGRNLQTGGMYALRFDATARFCGFHHAICATADIRHGAEVEGSHCEDPTPLKFRSMSGDTSQFTTM